MTEKTPEEYTAQELAVYEKKALKLLALARIHVMKKGPYFMRLIHTMVPVSVPHMGTIAVTDTMLFIYDPIRIVDDPEFSTLTEGLPTKLAGGMVHECQHILRGMDRLVHLAKTDMKLANIAGDLAINCDLRDAGWELPSWACYPENFNLPEGKTLEWYFQELLKDAENNKDKASGDIAGGGCGSIAANPSPAEAVAKELKGDKQRTPAQIENAANAATAEAKQHFAKAGTEPGWLKEAAGALKKKPPERNWEKELSHVVRRTTGAVKSGGSDYSMARPSRRSCVDQSVIRPGLVEQEIEVAIFWDTSGSMMEAQLNKARSVTIDVLKHLGIDSVLMAQGDTKISMDFTRVRLKDIQSLPCTGRGGTNFKPVFARLATMRPKPDVIIIVSDGDGPAPARPPSRVPVVWVIVPAPWSRRPTDWGHYVICSNDHDDVADTNKRKAR